MDRQATGGRERDVITLRIQSILFHNEPGSIRNALRSIRRAADLAIARGIYDKVEVAYGDCSTYAVLGDQEVARLREEHAGYFDLKVTFFGRNLGSAKGHNTLLEDVGTDRVLIMNPDVVLAPDALIELSLPFAQADVGMVEARQLPIEHPKFYDTLTGETPWATTACALIPRHVFSRIGPFDSDTFFLYCDDVDFSWRVRLAGMRVIYQPTATAFHDKRLSDTGGWLPGGAEKYYSAEAALLLAFKWSREDITRRLLHEWQAQDLDYLTRAATEFRRREDANLLPQQLDPEHKVAQFIDDGMYAKHRFGI
jgi:GT2 family glycosyltransferase